jgi:preprotein translocase subunit YajC
MIALELLAAEAPSGGGGLDLGYILLLVAPVILVFWVLSRPQRKREQERKAMIASLKKGDKVTTIGGIKGEVVRLDEREMTIRIDKKKDVEMTMLRTAISSVGETKAEAEGAKEGGAQG